MALLNSIVDRLGNVFDVGCNYYCTDQMPLFRDPRIADDDIHFLPCFWNGATPKELKSLLLKRNLWMSLHVHEENVMQHVIAIWSFVIAILTQIELKN